MLAIHSLIHRFPRQFCGYLGGQRHGLRWAQSARHVPAGNPLPSAPVRRRRTPPACRVQHLQPRGDVTRVLQPAIESAMRRQEGGAQLGDQFLHGVGRFPEAPTELAPEPGRRTRPVTQLMQRRAVVRRRIDKGRPAGQIDQVIGWRVERLEALMANLGPGTFHDLLGAWRRHPSRNQGQASPDRSRASPRPDRR